MMVQKKINFGSLAGMRWQKPQFQFYLATIRRINLTLLI